MKKVIPLVTFLFLFCSINAQGPEFAVQEENVEITINNDATVEIWYYLTIKTTQGPQRGIFLGIPEYPIHDYAASQNGKMLKVEKEATSLKIYFLDEAQTGDITELKVSFVAEGMIYPDEEGRVGMEFYPVWWNDQRMEVLRVKFILPEGCDISEVGNYPAIAENRGMEGGRAFVYFERANLDPGYKFLCGVSFPEEYVVSAEERTPADTPEASTTSLSQYFFVFCAILAVVVIVIMKIRSKTSKKQICPFCKREIQGDWSSCPHCGVRLTDDTRIY